MRFIDATRYGPTTNLVLDDAGKFRLTVRWGGGAMALYLYRSAQQKPSSSRRVASGSTYFYSSLCVGTPRDYIGLESEPFNYGTWAIGRGENCSSGTTAGGTNPTDIALPMRSRGIESTRSNYGSPHRDVAGSRPFNGSDVVGDKGSVVNTLSDSRLSTLSLRPMETITRWKTAP